MQYRLLRLFSREWSRARDLQRKWSRGTTGPIDEDLVKNDERGIVVANGDVKGKSSSVVFDSSQHTSSTRPLRYKVSFKNCAL